MGRPFFLFFYCQLLLTKAICYSSFFLFYSVTDYFFNIFVWIIFLPNPFSTFLFIYLFSRSSRYKNLLSNKKLLFIFSPCTKKTRYKKEAISFVILIITQLIGYLGNIIIWLSARFRLSFPHVSCGATLIVSRRSG